MNCSLMEPNSLGLYSLYPRMFTTCVEDGEMVMEKARVAMGTTLSATVGHSLAQQPVSGRETMSVRTLGKTTDCQKYC